MESEIQETQEMREMQELRHMYRMLAERMLKDGVEKGYDMNRLVPYVIKNFLSN